MKAEWMIVTIKCVYFIWNTVVWRQLSTVSKSNNAFTDFSIAEAWVSTRISHSFSSSRQLWFSWFYKLLKSTAKAEKLTWIVRSQDLSSNNLMRGNIIRGSLRINWIIRPNLTFACIIWNLSICILITNFSILQMLHGCRADLILKCLVNSKKDRNFFF